MAGIKKAPPRLTHQGEYLGGGRWAGPPKAAPLRYKGRPSSLAKARPPAPAPRAEPIAKPAAPAGGLPPFKLPSSWSDLWGGIKHFGQVVFGGAKAEPYKPPVTPELATGEPSVGAETTGYKPKFGEIWGEDEQGFYYTHPHKDTGIKTYVPYVPTFYEDPSRVVRMHRYMQGLVPGEDPPEGMDPKAIEAAYKYLQFRNNYAPESEWKALNENDEGRQFLQTLQLPPNSWLLPSERRFQRMEPQALDLQPSEELSLDEMDLAPWQKWTIEFLSSPLAQFSMGAVPGALMGASLGGIAGPLGMAGGAVLGAAGMGGLSYGATKSPTIANLLMKLDIGAELLERMQGMAVQTISSIVDPKRAGSLSELLADLPAAWKAAHLYYETAPSPYQMLMPGPGGKKAGLGQTFPSVEHWLQGRGAPEDIPGGVPSAMGPGHHTIEEVNAWILAHGGKESAFMAQTYGSQEALTEARRRIAAGEAPATVYAEMNDRYGFGALTNEMLGHIIIDPLNVAGEFIDPGVGYAARLAGATELADTLLTPKRVFLRLGDIGIGEYPGLVEGLATYGVRTRTGAFGADYLAKIAGSPLLRQIAGITADGKINTQGSIFRKLPIVGALFNRTAESRVVEVLGVSWDNLGSLLSRFDDPDDMVKAIRMLADNPAAAVREYGDFLGSPEMNTIAAALKDNVTGADALLSLWHQTEAQRTLLNGAADFLGIRADDVLSALGDTGKRDLMAQRLVARAVELRTAGQEIPAWAAQVLNKAGIDPAGFKGDDLYALLRVFVEDGGQAWHPQMFGAELLKTLEDGIETWAIQAFDVKRTPAIIRLSNTMRAAQSLVLLGLNPTYLVNNFINNEVSMLATGVMKLYAPGEMERFWTRMGVSPFRLHAGFGPAAGGGELPDFIAKLGEFYQPGMRLKEAQRVPGALANVDRAIHAASDKVGIFTRASRKIEQWASARAFTAGAQEFMRRFWQRGNGFKAMPPALEAALGGIDPNLPGLIYGTIEAGLSQGELETKLWREVIRTNAETYIPDVARQFGMDTAEVADMFDKTGVLRYLSDKLPAARTKEDVVRIFADLDSQVQSNLLDMARTEYGARAQAATARVRSEGMAGLVDLFYDVETRTLHWREQHAARLTNMWEQADLVSDSGRRNAIIRAGMDAAEADAVRTFSYQTAAYKGIVQALNDEGWAVPERLLASVDDMQGRWRGFFDQRRELYKEFFNTNWQEGAAGRARRSLRWEEMQDELDRLYWEVAGHENDLTEEVNRGLLEVTRKQLGDVAMERMAPGLRAVKDQLADMRAKMQDFIRLTRTMTRDERANAWRVRWADDVTDMRALIESKFKVVREAGFGNEPPPAPEVVPPPVPGAPGAVPAGTRLPPPTPGAAPPPELTAHQLALAAAPAGEATYTPLPAMRGPGQAAIVTRPAPAAVEPVPVPVVQAAPISPKEQIISIARVYGVDTATSAGVPNDRHALAIVNRYNDLTPIERRNLGVPEGGYTSLEDVQPDVASRAFARRAKLKEDIARGQPDLAGLPPKPARQWVDKAPGLPDTTEIYRNADGSWQTPRAKIHEDWISTRLASGDPVPADKRPVAIVLVGAPGSGKSRVRGMMEMADTVIADADDARPMLPEYNAGVAQSARNAAMVVHEEASEMAKTLRTRALAERKNLVIDVTGKHREGTLALLRELHAHTSAGQPDPYRVVVVGVWRDRDALLAGILARAEETGRHVPEGVVESALRNLPGNFEPFFREADDFSFRDFTDLARDREVWYGMKGKNDIIPDARWLSDWRAQNERAAAAAAPQVGVARYVEPGDRGLGGQVLEGGPGRPGVGPGRVRPPEPAGAAAGPAELQPVTRTAILAREQLAPPPPLPPPPPLKPPKSLKPGATTSAFGQDPTHRYDFHYAVVSLDELVTSNLPNGELNARYPKALQPRQRDRAAAMSQVQRIAGELEPDALLTDTHYIDRGSPIVGNLGVVESGNGRAMAMRIARDQVPDRWRTYQEKLRATLADFGLKPEDVEGIKDPVLVRIHNAGSDAERLAFVEDANASATLRMAPSETAAADVLKVSDELLASLAIGETDTIERALARSDNQILVKKFLEAVPENERGELVDATGLLNARGMMRLKAALFAKTYTGEAGAALSRLFTESIDPGIKNLETAMYTSLPRMAQAESLIRAGERAEALATGADIAAAVEKYSDLKVASVAVADYLEQQSMFGAELTPVQATILKWFSENNRSPKVLRDALNAYAQRVIDMPSTKQVGMFAAAPVSKEELWSAIINRQLLEVQEGTPLFAWGELAARTAPALEAGAGLEAAPGGLGVAESVGGPEGYRPLEAAAGPGGAPGAAVEGRTPAALPAAERIELASFDDLADARFDEIGPSGQEGADLARAERETVFEILGAYATESDAMSDLALMEAQGLMRYSKGGKAYGADAVDDALRLARTHNDLNPWAARKQAEVSDHLTAQFDAQALLMREVEKSWRPKEGEQVQFVDRQGEPQTGTTQTVYRMRALVGSQMDNEPTVVIRTAAGEIESAPLSRVRRFELTAEQVLAGGKRAAVVPGPTSGTTKTWRVLDPRTGTESGILFSEADAQLRADKINRALGLLPEEKPVPVVDPLIPPGGEPIEAPPARPTIPAAMTAEEVDAAPWRWSADQYQIAHGVEQPYIGEISPTQYARMGKQQKARYDAKRSAEWAASGNVKEEWRTKIIAAYDAGTIKPGDPSLTTEADQTLRYFINRDNEAKLRQTTQTAMMENLVQSMDELAKDQDLYSPIYGRVSVFSKHTKTVSVIQLEGASTRPIAVGLKHLQYFTHDDVAAAVKAGTWEEMIAPIRAKRPAPVEIPKVKPPDLTKGPTTLFQLVQDEARLSVKDEAWWNAIGKDKPGGEEIRVYVVRREGEPTEFVRAGDVVTFSRAQAETQAGMAGRVISTTVPLADLAERPGGGAIWFAPKGQEALPGFEPVIGDTATTFFPKSTRLGFREAVRSAFSLSDDQASGILGLTDARAGVWGKYTGRTVDEYYQTHIAGVLTESEIAQFPELVGKRGAVTFLDDGRAVIRAFKSSDASTVPHELAHIFRRDLEGETLMMAEEWAGVVDGKWTVEAEEKFANGFLDYLATGSAPSPKLAELFGRFKDWLREVYKAITGTEWEKQISPEIRTVFDRLISDEKTSSPAFLEWFAGSRAIDADTHRPIVLYHGTQRPGFEAFDPMKADPDGLAGPGAAYLTTSARVAGGVMERGEDGIWRLKHAGYALSIPTEVPPEIATRAARMIRESEEWQQKVSAYSSTGYLTSSEKAFAAKALELFEESGNPGGLTTLARQPYNMDTQGMLARAGVELEAGAVIPGWASIQRPFLWSIKVTPEDANDITRAVTAFVDDPDLILAPLQKEEMLRGRGPEEFMLSRSGYVQEMQAKLRGFLTDFPEWWESGGKEGGIAQLYGKSGLGSNEALYNELVAYCDESKTLANAILEHAGFDSIVYEGGTRMGFESHTAIVIFRPDQFKGLYNRGTFELYEPRYLYQDPPATGPRVPGSTPEPWFESEVMGDGWDGRVLPLLGSLRDRMTGEGAQRTFSAASLPEDLQGQLRGWMGGVYNDMATTKMGAIRFGENRRDLGLLNYNKRTNLDVGSQVGMPYSFWYMHTPLNWVIRALDKPAWLTTYARIRNLQENMLARPGWPTRLTDKFKIPMPFLPDWMGDGVYVDPVRQFFPWSQTSQPWDMAVAERRQIDTRAEYVVQKLEADGRITAAQAREALTARKGEAWEMAKAQATNEVGTETSNPIDFISLMSSPALPISWAWNIIRNKGAKIGMLPPERTLYAFTGWNPGAAIREGLNKTFGWELPTVDRFHVYRVERMLTNMVAESVIDLQTANLAMVEHTGPAYEEAERRVRQQYMLGQLMPGMAVDVFPIGEMEQRGLKAVFDRAYEAYSKGDKTALRQFFERYPQYEARLALYDKPEERLRQYLISSIWDSYTALGKLHKQQVTEQLGDYFETAFLNKETASPETLDLQTLAAWAQALGAVVPKTEALQEVPSYQTQLALAAPAIAGAVDAYRAKRNEDFPNWYALQSAYYERPAGGPRRKFLTLFPELKEYWDWRRGFIRDHPELEPYIVSQATTETGPAMQLDKFSPLLLNQIGRTIYAGQPLSNGAQAQLRYIWEQAGRPGGTFEVFLEIYVYPSYRQTQGQAGAIVQ